MGPGKPVESKRGRKRKSEVANDDDKSGADEEDSTSKGKGKEKSSATLDGLFKSKATTAAVTVVGSIPSSSAAMNELPREGEEFEESQMETQDETQETQKKVKEVEMETQEEEEETQTERTQVDEEVVSFFRFKFSSVGADFFFYFFL